MKPLESQMVSSLFLGSFRVESYQKIVYDLNMQTMKERELNTTNRLGNSNKHESKVVLAPIILNLHLKHNQRREKLSKAQEVQRILQLLQRLTLMEIQRRTRQVITLPTNCYNEHKDSECQQPKRKKQKHLSVLSVSA